MKVLSSIFLLVFGLAVYGQTNNPFLTLKFDKVIMYDFEPSGGKGGFIVEDNRQTRLSDYASTAWRLPYFDQP